MDISVIIIIVCASLTFAMFGHFILSIIVEKINKDNEKMVKHTNPYTMQSGADQSNMVNLDEVLLLMEQLANIPVVYDREIYRQDVILAMEELKYRARYGRRSHS